MDSTKIDAFEKIKECIISNENFVLQGGAGSGKTETLKQTLEFISAHYPKKKIACITHTNLAVDEIKSRVGEGYTISTIHLFLNECIKDYKNNLHKVIYELFRLDLMERQEIEGYEDEKEQKEKEHKKYKKLYTKYASSLYTVKNERVEKVQGKRDYDKSPEDFNTIINNKIEELNAEILKQIEDKDCNQIEYNDTRFDSFRDLTYGHDGLLDISALLFEKYPNLGKILQDKFDCIFIDEYQDTNEKIIDVFLKELPSKEKTLIGLFGDSMQAIYSDGIGDVEKYVEDKVLKKIDKEDNYRCSEQVIKFINNLRNDSLEQEVAFKKNGDVYETIEDRQGTVEFYYSFYEDKPHSRSTQEAKDTYISALDKLISKALNSQDSFRQLKLTNKSIAFDAGFESLYEIFNKRFTDNKEAIDQHLVRLQLADLYELCNAYKPHENSDLSPDYNLVLSKLKKLGVGIKKISDKQKIKDNFDEVISSELSLFKTLEKAFELKILKKSEPYLGYIEKRKKCLSELSEDTEFIKFKALYLGGKNTLTRIKNDITDIDEYDFKELEGNVKKEIFYNELFSDKTKFQDVINYFNYQNEHTQYITMHKTKGSGIDNVLVVLDEYFWNSEYNFQSIFSDEPNLEKKLKNQKLFYVACSRAKSNLKVVRLVSSEAEKEELNKIFDNLIEISS